ncbi:MAG: acetylornithine deacetylase [Chromatiales bacterium]|nr:acetylornithine deacetylase [Chromatiales bacterium]
MTAPSLIEMITQLIAAPSVSSISSQWDQSNRGVIELLERWLKDLGFKVEVLPLEGAPGKYNLIASSGSGPDGLVLSGHTDTVPYDLNKWQTDPFTLTERDNRLYGLGTSDMKAFFALVIEAVRELDLSTLKHPLTIIATADEETTMCGAQQLVDLQRRLGRHALIGEPTGLRPIRTHKGISMETIRVIGHSGHSSNPALGANALEGMHQVIGEILNWRQSLQQRYQNPLFEVAVPTLNLGHIHGGDNPNRICAECELQIDIRPLPGMDLNELRGEMAARLKPLFEQSKLRLELETAFSGIPAMETAADAAIIKTTEELTGHSAEAVAFGTEGPYLQQMGMEPVILGPGDIDQAHQPDEFISIERLQPMITILQNLIRKLCM